MVEVQFVYVTGLSRRIFSNARLGEVGTRPGRQSEAWSEQAMTEIVGEDGCPAFVATSRLRSSRGGQDLPLGGRAGRPVR